jgi:hypothetical protein
MGDYLLLTTILILKRIGEVGLEVAGGTAE